MISKEILDKWATAIVPKEAIWVNSDGEPQVNQNKMAHYEQRGYIGDEVLWIAPKDCLRIEFEGTSDENHRFILEAESACKSLGFDYCITSHGGKSDYLNLFNIKGIPLTDDNQNAKLLLVDLILPSKAKEQLDRSNLGWTLSPVIGHPHWKPNYNGAIHKIIRGKNPLEHKNEYPKELLKQLNKSKIQNKKYVVNIKQSADWVEEFLLNFCCNNELPKGARHFVIEKNLAAFIIHRKDKEEIKSKYFLAQKRRTDTLRTWEISILRGNYTNVSAGELAKFIKEYSLPFDIPSIQKEDIEEEQNKIETSFILDGNNIIEEIFDGKEVKFAIYNDGKIIYAKEYIIDDITYCPYYGDDVIKKVVFLAATAVDYENEEKLVEEIESFLRKWVGINNEFYKISTYYILTSWVYDRFDTINYLRALGDTGTGKSRFLDVIGGLCYKFMKISGAVTPAPVYRILEKWKGTLGIEEADWKESDETNEIIKILNCGFERGNPIIRCDKNNPSKLDFFDSFGPKIIATRKEFWDIATEARCLTEKMMQDDTKPDTKTNEFYEERQQIINKLLMFRFKNYFNVDINKVLDIDLNVLEPRLRQASRSFLALVWDKPEILEKFKQYLKEYNKEIIESRSNSWIGVVVNVIAEAIVIENDENLTCKWIAEQSGKDYNSRNVGRIIKEIGLKITAKKVSGLTKKLLNLTNFEHLTIVFKRYIAEDILLEKLVEKGYRVTKVTEVTQSLRDSRNYNNNIMSYVSQPDTPTAYKKGVGQSNLCNLGNSVTDLIPIDKTLMPCGFCGLTDYWTNEFKGRVICDFCIQTL